MEPHPKSRAAAAGRFCARSGTQAIPSDEHEGFPLMEGKITNGSKQSLVDLSLLDLSSRIVCGSRLRHLRIRRTAPRIYSDVISDLVAGRAQKPRSGSSAGTWSKRRHAVRKVSATIS